MPESIYTLNTAGLEPFFGDDGERLRARMKPGAEMALPDGQGSIAFEGYARWVKLQMSQTPGNPLALASLAVGTLGLCLSLFVKPRRMFVRVTEGDVLVAGLDRSDTALGLEEEVEELAQALRKDSP